MMKRFLKKLCFSRFSRENRNISLEDSFAMMQKLRDYFSKCSFDIKASKIATFLDV